MFLGRHAQITRRKGRSTIEVHPKYSEFTPLRSSIPHPKTDFSKNQNASRRIIPWPKSTKRFFFVEIKIDIPTTWGRRTPSFGNKIAEMCYLYRRTGQKLVHREGAVCGFPQKEAVLKSCSLCCTVAAAKKFIYGSDNNEIAECKSWLCWFPWACAARRGGTLFLDKVPARAALDAQTTHGGARAGALERARYAAICRAKETVAAPAIIYRYTN